MKNDKNSSEEETERTITDRAFLKTVITSVISICICLFCLCGGTWAWFSATKTGATASVRAGEYSMTTVVDGTELTVLNGRSSFTATAGTVYSVKLTAAGSASTGFCVITYQTTDEESAAVTGNLYTKQLSGSGAESLEFTICLTNGGTLTFLPQWGSCSVESVITDNQAVTV